MKFAALTKHLNRSRSFRKTSELVSNGDHFTVTGLNGSAVSFLLNSLITSSDGIILAVMPDYKTLERVQADIEAITNEFINIFPAYRGLHLDEKPINKDIKLSRLKCLLNLTSGVPGIYLVEARSLLFPLIDQDRFSSSLLTLSIGDEADLDETVKLLIDRGFKREAMVEDFGEISVRGGILDIFSPGMLEPVRIEFDFDTIHSLRVFDINTQRSLKQIDSLTVIPPLHDTIPENGIGELQPERSVLGFFPENAPVFFHRPVSAHKAISDYIKHWQDELSNGDEYDEDKIAQLFKNIESVFESRRSAYVRNSFTKPRNQNYIEFDTRTLPRFNRNLKMFARYAGDLQQDCTDLIVGILCDNQGQTDRLKDMILDEELLTSNYFVSTGSLGEGFSFTSGNLLLINDHEIFSRKHLRKPRRVYRARRVILDDLSLKTGDYVVQEDYGIGRYLGLRKIQIGGSEQEALKIQYRDGDSLFLNIDRLQFLEKYSGQEGHQPELSKLGGTDWIKLKNKTKKSLRNITNDLLAIHAARQNAKGYQFAPDTQWQRELEASFMYAETPDQLKACWDIKNDMESSKPMDRLICGDVGFGKTEVALRAAFKAVNDNKQVAVLVPTTILAQQHFETFRDRLDAYPVNVEMLSRFRTRTQQKQVTENVSKGTVDIVIGTHRLLSKDVEFKDLGLLIIDEEQRFGVAHKEKLKKLRAEVDVLTLTATPIPRTMQMAVMGARDLSTINTPPRNRLPIITEISEYDEELIRAAIMKELDRGGQVYFVHNRVQSINRIVEKLEKIVPEASYGIAHGQMKEKELEQVMFSFLRGDFDCLVSTMIIESGLDIPSVNTIIVNQADNFGLAQLYQLRGRVGRSDIQAFAYLLTPPFVRMTDVAISRLQTLSENTELGAGLQVALKDLEIRGAGNLIGAEQSGHINAVGFDMYTKLVKEAVEEKLAENSPGQMPKPELKAGEVKFDTDISAYLPPEYIPDEFQRVSFYRKIAAIDTFEELTNISSELTDRYGKPPEYAKNLLSLMRVKIKASELLFRRLQVSNNLFTGTFLVNSEATAAQKEQLARLVSSFVDKSSFQFRLKQDDRLKIELPLQDGSPEEKLDTILEFFDSINEEQHEH